MHCYLEIRKAQIKTAQEKVHNTKNPLTLVLTSSSLLGSKHSIVVQFLNILVIHMPTHTKASFLLHSWFLKKLVLFKPRMQTPICKTHKAPMDKSLYTFISTRWQISDLQEIELAVLSNHLYQPWCSKNPMIRVKNFFFLACLLSACRNTLKEIKVTLCLAT